MSKPDIKQLLAQKDVSGLVRALKDKDLQVSTQAAFALGALGFEARAALPALREALSSAQTLKDSQKNPKNAKDFARNMEISGYYETIQKAMILIEQL